MKTRSRRTVAALVACLGLIGIFAVAVTVARAPDDKALAQGLRSGGFVIVVRHGPTFADIEDGDLLNLDSNAAQLNLNDEGETLARAFGRAMHDVGIPVGRVFTSKYNGAYETAVLAGFEDIVKAPDLTDGGLVISPREYDRRAEGFRKMLAMPPNAGTNTILNYAPTESRCRAWQRLARRETRRGFDFSTGEWHLQIGRAGAD